MYISFVTKQELSGFTEDEVAILEDIRCALALGMERPEEHRAWFEPPKERYEQAYKKFALLIEELNNYRTNKPL